MFFLHLTSNKRLILSTIAIKVCSLLFPKDSGDWENDLYLHFLLLCGLKQSYYVSLQIGPGEGE